MKEKLTMDYVYCLSEEDPNPQTIGLKISNSIFHSSFTFTGMQLSYMLNCKNGLIVKINTNQDQTGEQKDFNVFNKSLAPIIAPEEQHYPRGKYPFLKTKKPK